jgi:NAD(P)-dependent dehydrogenase (short-subunit alcohol dehydrogenase family)
MQASYPSLVDRAVLVTGGATGIGADIVRAFAAQGARVSFLDLQDGAARALVDELAGGRHAPRFLRCDLTDIGALGQAIAEAGADAPAAVLVNNAANDQRTPVEEITPQIWDDLMAVNLRAQFFAAQAVVPGMRRLGGGSIINMSSVAWRLAIETMAAYTTAKAGVQGLTMTLARALGPDNIRVNAIEPGAVMTERQRRLWYPTQASVDAMVARQVIQAPLLGSDIAEMALFLASDAARLITKQTMVVDAGLS